MNKCAFSDSFRSELSFFGTLHDTSALLLLLLGGTNMYLIAQPCFGVFLLNSMLLLCRFVLRSFSRNLIMSLPYFEVFSLNLMLL